MNCVECIELQWEKTMGLLFILGEGNEYALEGELKGFFFSGYEGGLLLCNSLLPARSSYIPALHKCVQWQYREWQGFLSLSGRYFMQFCAAESTFFPVTSIAMLLRPCLGRAILPCSQSLKNIQDYCMLKQLNFFISYFILLPSWKWQY